MHMKYSLILAAAVLAFPALAEARDNPLLTPSPLEFNYPPFDKIQDSDFAPALDAGMAQQRREVDAIANNPAAPTFDNTIVAMEKSGEILRRSSTILFNLIGADNNPARTQLEEDYAPKLAAHNDAINLDEKLFQRVQALYLRRAELGLDPESLRLLERYHSDMVRAGAELGEAQKTRLKAINAELASLSAEYDRKSLAEVNDSAVVVNSREELAGLSEAQIIEAANAAKARKLDGKYLLILKNTTDQPMLAQLQNRAVRERLFKASLARGSRGGPNDTRALFARVLALRAESAQLLGFSTYADYALANETAKTVPAVNGMLHQLAGPSVAAARREGAELQAVIDKEQAARKQPSFKLEGWDWMYYTSHLQAEKFGAGAEEVKPYFELKHVMEEGVFYAANQLYGLTFKQRHDLPLYNPDITTYDVFDADGKHLAIFIDDPYARASKQGGAWMNTYVDQSGLLGLHPVVANHLNIPKPADGKPTLLTWDEVTTAFHEFGHALHGMFSNVRYPTFTGANVPPDFGEYPSQVNEMWAAWPQVLAHYAKHYQTGAPMPQALIDQVQAERRFNQGYLTTAVMGATVLDQRLHQLPAGKTPSADKLMAFEAQVLKEEGFDYAPVPPRYRTPYFTHIMGMGYSAGYYAYLWSEILDANTGQWYRANGGLTRANGDTFRDKVLSRGGSRDEQGMFRSLVGHDPQIEPLLERRGFVATKP